MNNKFKKLSVPRIVGLRNNLIGYQLPERSENDSSVVGRYVDTLCKTLLGEIGDEKAGVDIRHLMIEVKSKDIQTNSDWTIGTMTLEDIISKNYTDSIFYEKLQALWLIRYDNNLRIIQNSNIYYFDSDEIQEQIEKGYESCRNEVITFYNKQLIINQNARKNALFVFENEDEFLDMGPSQQFRGVPGYRMEYSNAGHSIKFRISIHEMNSLARQSEALNSKLFEF